MKSPESLPRIAILACGGTIASTRSGTHASPTLSAAELIADLPELQHLARVVPQSMLLIASPDITLLDVLNVHARADRLVREGEVDGIVVTMGTDTLDEAAFGFDLLWSHDVPFVVTGALRNLSKPSPDGPANLIAAVAVAAAPIASDLGVVVVVNDEIHAASRAVKTHTANVAAFTSPGWGPLGAIVEGTPHLAQRLTRRTPTVTPGHAHPGRIALLTMALGDDGSLLPAIADGDFAGLVIAGFPGGHVSREFADHPALEQVLQRMPVVLASRAHAGEPLRATYSGFRGSEAELLKRGLLPSFGLAALKARIALAIISTHNDRNIGEQFLKIADYETAS